jgi:hypothetical protein
MILNEERLIAEDEFLTHVIEADSFNDTIKEVEAVGDLGYAHDKWMIAVNSVEMYTIIDDYRHDILTELLQSIRSIKQLIRRSTQSQFCYWMIAGKK